MVKVITYGTYDLLHQGHINLLRRAKELGDYLIVGVTSDSFDRGRGKLNVRNNVLERVEAVRATGYADEVIIEDYVGQKIDDIQKYDVDIFAIGSDWVGKFDYLNEYCKVVYLPRTEGISSTQLREESQSVCKIGVIGSGRIARRFVPETKVVSGAEVVAVLNPEKSEAESFAEMFGLEFYDNFDRFIREVDAVYIASPHLTHYEYAKRLLQAGKHGNERIRFVCRVSFFTIFQKPLNYCPACCILYSYNFVWNEISKGTYGYGCIYRYRNRFGNGKHTCLYKGQRSRFKRAISSGF